MIRLRFGIPSLEANYNPLHHTPATAKAIDHVHSAVVLTITIPCVAADWRSVVLKTSSKLMLEVLSQLDLFTSGTSWGSAKVMSTHCIHC